MMKTAMTGTARYGALLIVTLATTLSADVASAQCPPRKDEIVWNGRLVPVSPGANLLSLVRIDPRSRRLESVSNQPNDVPVVVVNGAMTVAGLSVLRDVDISEVDSLTILGPVDAVNRYGSLAGRGAVVLTTRSGLTRREASKVERRCGQGGA
jgi:hypothetical protein